MIPGVDVCVRVMEYVVLFLPNHKGKLDKLISNRILCEFLVKLCDSEMFLQSKQKVKNESSLL